MTSAFEGRDLLISGQQAPPPTLSGPQDPILFCMILPQASVQQGIVTHPRAELHKVRANPMGGFYKGLYCWAKRHRLMQRKPVPQLSSAWEDSVETCYADQQQLFCDHERKTKRVTESLIQCSDLTGC